MIKYAFPTGQTAYYTCDHCGKPQQQDFRDQAPSILRCPRKYKQGGHKSKPKACPGTLHLQSIITGVGNG